MAVHARAVPSVLGVSSPRPGRCLAGRVMHAPRCHPQLKLRSWSWTALAQPVVPLCCHPLPCLPRGRDGRGGELEGGLDGWKGARGPRKDEAGCG